MTFLSVTFHIICQLNVAQYLNFCAWSLQLHTLTCDWSGLRGGERSESEPLPPCGRLLGGDWSESQFCPPFRLLLGGDWSESEALPICVLFLGGDWSESEPGPFWARLLGGDWSDPEERWPTRADDKDLAFFLDGDESEEKHRKWLQNLTTPGTIRNQQDQTEFVQYKLFFFLNQKTISVWSKRVSVAKLVLNEYTPGFYREICLNGC